MDDVPRVLSFLTSRAPPLEMNGQVYVSCVRSSMPYGSETMPLLQMIRWMCSISMKDRSTSEELRRLIGVVPITNVIRSGRLRWYEHVMRTR